MVNQSSCHCFRRPSLSVSLYPPVPVSLSVCLCLFVCVFALFHFHSQGHATARLNDKWGHGEEKEENMMKTPYSNSSLVSTPLIFFMNYKKKTFPARQIELVKEILVNCSAHEFNT